jgi:hypothetical protein
VKGRCPISIDGKDKRKQPQKLNWTSAKILKEYISRSKVAIAVPVKVEDTMKDRRGYIYFNKNEKCWYARTTVTDERGTRRNIKNREKNKSEAREILKSLP